MNRFHDLAGHHDGEIGREDRHHQHGIEEHISGRAVQAPALLRDRGDRPRNQPEHAPADVKAEGKQGYSVKHGQFLLPDRTVATLAPGSCRTHIQTYPPERGPAMMSGNQGHDLT